MTTQATFCATLVDEWSRAGAGFAAVSPGSRSTPLALALARQHKILVEVVLDERSAAYMALGVAMASGRPSIIVCTSGTAAPNLHPAVVEADLAGVPLIVCTADRPPELRDVGAPQAIDQTHLFGRSVRWFHDPGVPDDAMKGAWRGIASRAYVEAVRGPGPVHLNLPFRDPLIGDADALPSARPATAPWHRADPAVGAPSDLVVGGKGVVVAGLGADPRVGDLAATLGWPVLADPLSGLRRPGSIATADALARCDGWIADRSPHVVVHAGRPWASKALNAWLAGLDARHVLVDPSGRWPDPDRIASEVVLGSPTPGDPAPRAWLTDWQAAEVTAQGAIEVVLDHHDEITEPGIARRLTKALPDGAALVVASSMPVRDVEWYGIPREGLRVFANRGANGIDGVASTAVGVGLVPPSVKTVCLLGDLAFLHDLSGVAAGRRVMWGSPMYVFVDNNGGGIFSFLPQAGALKDDEFERLFGTPHDLDLVAVAAGLGFDAVEATNLDDILLSGAEVVVARTDRAANVKVHDEIHAVVADALRA